MQISLPRTKPGHYRLAVSAFYFIQGLVFASWASRIPDIKTALGLNDAALGGVLFAIPVGQMSAMALSGFAISRFGSRKVLTLAAFLYPVVLVWLGMAGTVWELCAALFFFGITANLCNIAVNTQGVGVERIYRRSIMASFHGLWSLAGFLGGLISTLMVGLNMIPAFHFALIFVLSTLILLVMKNAILPRDITAVQQQAGEDAQTKIRIKPDRYIVILGCIVFGCMMCEGTMYDWSSVYFDSVIRPSKELVRLGYITSMCAMTCGRFMADRLVTRFGVVHVVRASGITIAAGLLLAVGLPYLVPATIGFLLVGFGVSSVVPICYSMAGKSTKMLPGVALTAVSSIGFLGFLIGPPLIGFVAQAINLRWSLGLVAIIGIVTSVLASKIKEEKCEG